MTTAGVCLIEFTLLTSSELNRKKKRDPSDCIHKARPSREINIEPCEVLRLECLETIKTILTTVQKADDGDGAQIGEM